MENNKKSDKYQLHLTEHDDYQKQAGLAYASLVKILMVANGLSILALVQFLASNGTSMAIKFLMFKSLWAFSLGMVFTFLGAVASLLQLELMADGKLDLADYYRLGAKHNKRWAIGMSKIAKSVDISVPRVSFVVIGAICFIIGLFLPLISITLYDYF